MTSLLLLNTKVTLSSVCLLPFNDLMAKQNLMFDQDRLFFYNNIIEHPNSTSTESQAQVGKKNWKFVAKFIGIEKESANTAI